MRTSYSAINTYTTCPLKYKYLYVEKIDVAKSEPAVFGSLVHRVLHFYHDTSPTPTQEELVDHFSRHWKSTVYDDERIERERFAEGVAMVKRYQEAVNPREHQTIALELPFQATIARDDRDDNPVVLTGMIDRIDKLADGRYEIIDYKTGRTLPSQDAIDRDLQLSVYWLALREKWPNRDMTGTIVSLYFLKHGEKVQSRRTVEQIDQTKRTILETVRVIERGEFSPTPSALCDYCEFRERCPMMRHKFRRSRDAKMSEQEIAQRVQEYVGLKDEEKRLRLRLHSLSSELLEYCRAEELGRLFSPANDCSVMLSRRETYGYDEQKLRAILGDIGRLDDVLKVDQVALKKVIAELPSDVRKALEGIRALEKTTESLTIKRS